MLRLIFKNKPATIALFFFLFVYLITAINSKGFYHWDEHYQIIEFASYKLGKTPEKELAWEFKSQIRPAFQPAITCFAFKIFGKVGFSSPFMNVMFLRLISSILSFITLLFVSIVLIKKYPDKIFLILIITFSLWFLPFIGARYSSETMSGIFLTAGICTILFLQKSKLSYILAGTLLGISFLFRFQSGIVIASTMLWLLFINKSTFKQLMFIVFPVLIVFCIGILIDKWFYGNWTITSFKYLYTTLFQENAPDFGISPWYYYLSSITIDGFLPVGILLIVICLLYFITNIKSLISWVLIPFILIHCFIGHKELRFLFPIVFLLPFVISYFLLEFKLSSKLACSFIFIFLVLNLVPMIVMAFRPANKEIADLEYMNKRKINETFYYVIDNPALIYGYYSLPSEDWYYYKTWIDSIPRIDTCKREKYLFIPNYEFKKIPKQYSSKVHQVHPESSLIKKYYDFLSIPVENSDLDRTLYKFKNQAY